MCSVNNDALPKTWKHTIMIGYSYLVDICRRILQFSYQKAVNENCFYKA